MSLGEIKVMVKRTLDIVFPLLVLMAATPLFMLIGILVKLDSRGPVFYRGVRVGRLGNPFRMYKFRTMVVNADMIGGPSTADDDPRNTKVGRFLRTYIEMDPGFRTGS